ncbi:unnamed protein product, partial [Ilex paraguariensis]
VVPTVCTDVCGHTIHSNQFSVTEHFRGADIGHLQSLPGVFFFYDLRPIKVGFVVKSNDLSPIKQQAQHPRCDAPRHGNQGVMSLGATPSSIILHQGEIHLYRIGSGKINLSPMLDRSGIVEVWGQPRRDSSPPLREWYPQPIGCRCSTSPLN